MLCTLMNGVADRPESDEGDQQERQGKAVGTRMCEWIRISLNCGV
jgi:hypothetical protein